MYTRRRKSPLILPEVVMTAGRKKQLALAVVVLVVDELLLDGIQCAIVVEV